MVDRQLIQQTHALIGLLSPEEQEALFSLLDPKKPLWAPNPDKDGRPNPQRLALESKADEVFFGGSAGGGKSDLLLGCALTRHHTSIIFRREYPQHRAMILRSRQLLADQAAARQAVYNSQQFSWSWKDGRLLEFGACQYEHDVQRYMGRPHDFIGYDEASHLYREQFIFLSAWNRPAEFSRQQRCRIILTGNPPTNPEGRWIVEEFAPWLERDSPDPAAPGELRYYERRPDNSLLWSREPRQIKLRDGDTSITRSRTFIPSRVDDNPHLLRAGYKGTLQNLPEPWRSQLLYGDFSAGMEDSPQQVIPTLWIMAAQARWAPEGPEGGYEQTPLSALGADVARGGKAKTVLSPRYGEWFAPLLKYPGASTPDGAAAAALIRSALAAAPGARRGGAAVNLDPIGVGSAVFDLLRQGRGVFRAIDFRAKTFARDRSGYIGFKNTRAHAYWSFREALDPSGTGRIALPPDPELLADLACPRWKETPQGILIESKEDIEERLHRSPDCGDAAVLAWYQPTPLHYGEAVQPRPVNPYDPRRHSSIRRRGFLGLRPPQD